MNREDEVVAAFVRIAGSLVAGEDVPQLLDHLTSECVRLLEVDSVGLLLADARGALHVLAASSQSAAELDTLQAQRAQGPCYDCYSDGRPVHVPDIAAEAARWPLFVPLARSRGVTGVDAVPLRLRDQVIGALGLFRSSDGVPDAHERDMRLAQGLADVATIAIIQERIASDRNSVNEQLQTALITRVVLEQAKGVLAYHGEVDMTAAYDALVRYSRDFNVKIGHVARALVERTLPPSMVLEHARRH